LLKSLKILSLLLIPLCGCGGKSKSIDDLLPVYIHSASAVNVRYGYVQENKIGYTYIVGDIADIYIREGFLGYKEASIITHELFHALGYIGHLREENCYFSFNLTPNTDFCQQDVDLLLNLPDIDPLLVRSSPELEQQTKEAINLINNIRPLLIWNGTL